MKIIQFNAYADVFYGEEGWEPAARFRLNKTEKGVFIKQIKGTAVPSHIFSLLIKEFNK